MSNVKGYKALKTAASPQTLTTGWVVLGEQFVQPDVEQMFVYVDYTAGDEDGLSIALRSDDAYDSGNDYQTPSYESVGGGEFMVAEEVIKIPKAAAGYWKIPVNPKGEKNWKVMVKGYGASASGTVSGFVRFYDNI